jgi:fructose transport system substrate-binding protein
MARWNSTRGRTRRSAALVAAVATASLALAACGGGSSGGTGTDGGGDVGVTLITKNVTNPFFVAMQNGAKEAATAAGIKLETAAGKSDGDEAGQVTAIENSISRGDAGILITPSGPGVNAAIKKARDAGLYVIALDTPPDPAETVDITFATDNFEAGKLIGQWAAKKLGGKPAVIAMLDLFNDKVVSVDYNRDQGFLTGMGIDVKDAKKNGDESPTGNYDGGTYTIVCNLATQGAEDGGRTAMENCLAKNPDINLVYTINEPAASGADKALKAASKTATIVSVDGGCDPGMTLVKSKVIGATSQQYPLKMASLGVEAIAKYAKDKSKPTVSEGLDFFNTGVALVTDDPQDGVESIDSTKGLEICWGKKA